MTAATGDALPRSPSPELQPADESSYSLLEDYGENEDLTGSGRDSSGPDEAVFDHHADVDGAQSSPGTSQHSDDDISELPADSRRTSCNPINEPASPVTPQKQRSPFRNPSSVRAMQLDTTPPHLMSGSRYQKYRMSGASRNSTPKSTKSFHSVIRTGRTSPTKSPRKEFPLVLLHVTLLPVSCPYSPAVLERVLPGSTIQNWLLLQEKVTDTVLERGILIPHPREDYDLLEERLLESLELKTPRILKCGHFHMTPEEEAEIAASEDEYDSDGDQDMCQDCGRRIRDGRFGAGSGQQRWSIKVYASNGLMRAGAWGAAWQEMERVDVEILPWLDDQMKRELDLRREEETAEAALHQIPPPNMDEQRRKEIYGEQAETFSDQFIEENASQAASSPKGRELPLTELFALYLHHLLQDRRNLAIAFLSVVVVFLAVGAGSSSSGVALKPVPSAEVVVPSVNVFVPSAEAVVHSEHLKIAVASPSLDAVPDAPSIPSAHESELTVDATETFLEVAESTAFVDLD